MNEIRASAYLRIHHVWCRTLGPTHVGGGSATEGSAIKICAESVLPLIQVARQRFEEDTITACDICRPSLNPEATRYWWVNHKQSHIAELTGGFIWAPQFKSNGKGNRFYDNLRLVRPGDYVFSYAGGQVTAVGVALEIYSEAPKPSEFSRAPNSRDEVGWRVAVQWRQLSTPFQPKQHLDALAPLFAQRYSPLRPNGNGNQGCYLAEISEEVADVILSIAEGEHVVSTEDLGSTANRLVEEHEVEKILQSELAETEKKRLVASRLGQGKFCDDVLAMTPICRITGIKDQDFLIASHIKPWRVSSNKERLDGANGLALSPHVDRLFDRGWISFADDGGMLVANSRARAAVEAWGLTSAQSADRFSAEQCTYLDYHRTFIHGPKCESTLEMPEMPAP